MTPTRENLKVMNISIQRNESSQAITHTNAVNAYQKGDMYCVMCKDEQGKYISYKYPINSIFRVVEDYDTLPAKE